MVRVALDSYASASEPSTATLALRKGWLQGKHRLSSEAVDLQMLRNVMLSERTLILRTGSRLSELAAVTSTMSSLTRRDSYPIARGKRGAGQSLGGSVRPRWSPASLARLLSARPTRRRAFGASRGDLRPRHGYRRPPSGEAAIRR